MSSTWADSEPLVLPSSPSAAGLARRHVKSALLQASPEVLATAVLLTSELVANAVEHGAPPVTLRIFRFSEVLRVEVADGGVTVDADRASPTWSSDAESGRGLLLVQALAADWGCIPHRHASDGQTVWFELAPD